MDILCTKSLKQKASSFLKQTRPDYRRLVLLHAVISLSASFLLFLIDLLLDTVIVDTGGLSGMGTRATFETVRSLLGLIISIALPFWQFGILYTSIRVTRRQEAKFHHLTRGFTRVGPLLRYFLLMLAIVIGITMVSSYVATFFLSLIQIPPELEKTIASLDEAVLSDPQKLIEAISVQQLLSAFWPVLLLMIVLCMGALIYILYRLRLCTYLLLDEEPIGVLQATSFSNRLTKGHKWGLFKLDLSFWWYYLLQALISSISTIPMLSQAFGTDLSGAVPNILCQTASTLASIALLWWAGAQVELTYACAYGELSTPSQSITVI